MDPTWAVKEWRRAEVAAVWRRVAPGLRQAGVAASNRAGVAPGSSQEGVAVELRRVAAVSSRAEVARGSSRAAAVEE